MNLPYLNQGFCLRRGRSGLEWLGIPAKSQGMTKRILTAVLLSLIPSTLPAAPAVQIPPPGLAIPADKLDRVKAEVAAFGSEIDRLKADLVSKPDLLSLMPDVEIFHKAAAWPVQFNEFYKTNEPQQALDLIKVGRERVAQLRMGEAPWTWATGLVVRAFRSRIDGSLQPYGLVVPAGYKYQDKPRRLDLWFPGRDEKRTELAFIQSRLRSVGEFAPADTIVLHPYGRFCNATKFAGETDVFEALAAVLKDYPIDLKRLSVRGFSMGGASTWHLAAHHAGLWAGAAPGAGFVEAAKYLKIQVTPDFPPSWEQKLWHLYSATDYAGNLFNTTVIAYSGELDKQKQAADEMEKAMAAEGLPMRHIIGPKVEHKYEPGAKKELAKQFDEVMAKGREAVPREVRLTTWTLRYNRQAWVRVDGLKQHWDRAQVNAKLLAGKRIEVATTNVTALTLDFPEEQTAFSGTITVVLDGQSFQVAGALRDHPWTTSFVRDGNRWKKGSLDPKTLAKRPGLQGPIDDAFMDSFLFVTPTGKARSPLVQAWVEAEIKRTTAQWRGQFRGDVRVKRDVDVTDADLAANNVVLWGDPESNRLIGKIAGKLPIRWDTKQIVAGKTRASSDDHAVVLIHPNPLNPERYVVLNSGVTFRGLGSNADQTPKLPDWAVIDVTKPITDKAPGGVTAAGFFDEKWELVR